MTARIVARETFSPFDGFEVLPMRASGPAVAVLVPSQRVATSSSTSSVHGSLSVHRFPTGERIAHRDFVAGEPLSFVRELALLDDADGDGWDDLRFGEEFVDGRLVQRALSLRTMSVFDLARDPEPCSAPRTIDLDGDGTDDALSELPYGTTTITSGRDGTTLFVDRDPLEYESHQRARLLGDLDGDGHGDFALLHPRSDRSKYDIELLDRIYGAKSWITLISGAKACGR